MEGVCPSSGGHCAGSDLRARCLVPFTFCCALPFVAQANPYAELNSVSDEALRERVIAIVSVSADDAGSELSPLSPIITYSTLLRLNNMVSSLDQHQERGGWGQHCDRHR